VQGCTDATYERPKNYLAEIGLTQKIPKSTFELGGVKKHFTGALLIP
jgi:hypothetical protein